MKFRELPEKVKLTILMPPEVDQALRDRAHRERRSLSEVASELVCTGLGRKPKWVPNPGPGKRGPTATAC